MFTKENIKKAFIQSIPIAIGYFPLGFICGVFLQGSGFNTIQIALISILVFGGSAQFIAASMVGMGASISSIIMTVFASNLRQMLYTSSLSIHIDDDNKFKLMGIAHFTTDEVYAVNSQQYLEGDWNADLNFLLGMFSHIYWILSNTAGGILGDVVDLPQEIASFTLIAMFMALIVGQVDDKSKLIVAGATFIIGLIVMNFYTGNFNIIFTSLLGASIGYIMENRGGLNV